ncbi:dephospho-CoA kinase [Ligilactobacillus apodemi]|uniref:dephospho-CoA kinase n=1 Tax=Ligilactobacillus apodemi TaxID=307126 RepID=UPI00214AEE8D|nr:dephospho-CoA kinase [Ligilactobacillus apodemi]MCR1900477.1 dephospho-CoA kinase [Ligilactobacillus apodemi]
MTYVLGLTGGIGMGKTTISNFLKKFDFKILDADLISRQVISRPATLQQLVACFGQTIIDQNGELDRKALGTIVFNNPGKLAQLDQIMQPLIRTEYTSQLKQARQAKIPVVVIDAALLFEQNYAGKCDAVMTVSLPQELQLKRIMQRDKITKTEALKRIASQIPDEKRKKMATIVIDSSGTVEETQAQVIKWLKINNLIEK